MKKLLRLLAALLCILTAGIGLTGPTAFAENATAYTYTISPKGVYMRTQDAYLPGSVLLKDQNLMTPEDLYIRDNVMYVADTGNRRILIYDLATGDARDIGQDFLQSPTGIYVNEKHEIYVADYGAQKVYHISEDGTEILHEYGRPKEAVYGAKTTYLPKKVAANKAGDVYIISEGGFDGVVNLNSDGEFMGYFGFNYTDVSLWDKVLDTIFTDRQKAMVLTKKPNPFYNLTIDDDGIIYTVTQGIKGDALKKHDISGFNMISIPMFDESNFAAVTTGTFGQMYAVTQTGLLFEYDANGMLLFSFGGKAIASERTGYFTSVSGLASDENDCLYVMDRERGVVHVFYPTDFIIRLHEAINLYENGRYGDSRTIWQEVIRQSGSSKMAYEYLARTYYQTQEYELAARYARIAENRIVYSDAFWEIRNKWMLDYLGYLIIGLALLAIGYKVYRIFRPKKVKETAGGYLTERLSNNLFEELLLMKRFIRHPADTFYYVRRESYGSVTSAIILYLAGFAVFAVNFFFRGFIFNFSEIDSGSLMYISVLYFVPLVLWIIGNFLVSSINEGEGRFRDVLVATSYSLTPLILFMPLITLSTYVITLNEAFVINMSSMIVWVWCAVLLFIGLKEIHDYTAGQVIKNILLTLFFMFIAVIVIFIIYMFWDKLFEFLYSVAKEVLYRVE